MVVAVHVKRGSEAPSKNKHGEMKHLSTEMKQQLDWRRSKVLELSSDGYSEREISEILKINDTAVHRDLVFIRRQAKENPQKHIDERIPEEYEKCIAGMNTVLKMTSYIANTVAAPKTKLQALSLLNDCYKYKMELATNGVVVTDAIKYVQGQMEHLNTTERKLLQDIKQKEEKKPPENLHEGKTTNGVF